MALTVAQVQQAYVAFFNRPADLAGLNYWVSSPAASVSHLLDAFSKTAEYNQAYGGKNSTELVNAVYQNLFGRQVESVSALNYWVGLLDKGTVTLGNIAATVSNLAIANKTTDGTLVNNKVTAATAFTDALSGAANAASASAYASVNSTGMAAVKSWLSGVTDNAATLTTAVGSGLTTVLTTVQANGTSNGSSFTLTTGEDSGTKFTGGAANDTFSAGVAQDGAGNLKNTLQNIDSLNGGDGVDTLEATLNDAAVVAPVLASIENVSVRLTNAAAGIDLTNATGVTNLKFNASTAAGGTNVLGSATGLSISNQKVDVTADKSTATTLALNFDKAGVVSTTAPTVVTLDLGKTAASKATTMNISVTDSNVKVDSTQADIATTVTVAATGANTLNLVDVAAVATSLSVTGTGSVDMSGTAFTKVATVTAADGGLKLDMTANTATALKVTTGAGADTLRNGGKSDLALLWCWQRHHHHHHCSGCCLDG